MAKFYPILVLSLLVFSCRKDIPPKAPTEKPVASELTGELLVMNEGNFLFANASLNRIDLASGVIESNYFEKINNQSMGDVAQSMSFYKGKAYFVMNNSQKIIVTDSVSLKKEQEISGLTSPRYLCFLHSQKAFVSDLYSHAISIINPLTGTHSGSIPLAGWTEEMCISQEKLFVGNWSGNSTYIVDANNDLVMDSVFTGKHSAWLSQDKRGNVWVLSAGAANGHPMISCLDAKELRIISQEELPLPGEVSSRLVYDSAGDQLFFLAKDVFSYRLKSASGERLSKVIRSEGNNFYGLEFDEARRILMVSDARNFIQKGSVALYQVDLQFEKLGQYECGMIPSGMVIR